MFRPLHIPRRTAQGREQNESRAWDRAKTCRPGEASIGRSNVRGGNNPKLRGGGIHHIAIEASDFEKSLRFYMEGLGFRELLMFP